MTQRILVPMALLGALALLPGCAGARLFQREGYSPELNEKAGFRDLKFGTKLDSVRDRFESCKDEEGKVGTVLCKKKDENLHIGGARLDGVFYSFYDGEFAGAYATCKGLENSMPLLDALRAAYGSPDVPNKFIENYEWHSGTTELSFKVELGSEDGFLMIWSPEIKRRERAAARARAVRAAETGL